MYFYGIIVVACEAADSANVELPFVRACCTLRRLLLPRSSRAFMSGSVFFNFFQLLCLVRCWVRVLSTVCSSTLTGSGVSRALWFIGAGWAPWVSRCVYRVVSDRCLIRLWRWLLGGAGGVGHG